MSAIDTLNPAQREAAGTIRGPILILAGAGTGKTRVITHRLAHMIERGIGPDQILAVTFTNKAAREMQSRVSKLIGRPPRPPGGGPAPRPIICTFHSLGVRILRAHGEKLGYKPNWTIFADTDQLAVVRRLLAGISPTAAKADAGDVLAALSRWRNQSVRGAPPPPGEAGEWAALLIDRYQSALRAANAVDFDDLLLQPLRLFRENAESLAACRNRHQYVMVDEYQDTNAAQFELVRLLTVESRNLCAVGDDDQSIYGWRGAEAANLLEFERHFPEARIVKLEQNYRSTNTILRAANAVISRNARRRAKQLWSEHGDGAKIRLEAFDTDDEEAKAIAETIEFERVGRGVPWRNQAVLFRTNLQSRAIEAALRQARVRYRVIGGQSFFDRREIRDFTSYLRMLLNPQDDPALLRIANVPARGLSDATMERLLAASHERRVSVYAVLRHTDVLASLQSRAAQAAAGFAAWIDKTRAPLLTNAALSLERWAGGWLADLGYRDELKRGEKDPLVGENRWMNLVELMADLDPEDAPAELPPVGANPAHQSFAPALRARREPFSDSKNPPAPPAAPAPRPYRASPRPLERLQEFTDGFALEPERKDTADTDVDAVTLITIHAAKGLEFPHAHLAGLEDGLLPHSRSKVEGTIDEERRLFYVAITRARQLLRISHCRTRRRYGQAMSCHPSPFLKDLPAECVEDAGAAARRQVPKGQGGDWFAAMRALVD